MTERKEATEAVAACRRAVALAPQTPEAHANLGNALAAAKEVDEAIASYRRALDLAPGRAEIRTNLGNALRAKGRLDEALAEHRRAIALGPALPEAYANLGIVLSDKGELEQAVAAQRQAIALRPGYAEAHMNLGCALNKLGMLDEAVAAHRQAIALKPGYADAYGNLGHALKDQGDMDGALAAYRQAIAAAPDRAEIHGMLAYGVHFHPDYDARAIGEEHRRWAQRHAEPLARLIRPHDNDPSPERRLRVGYVSPDFHAHPVGRFILPLLERHDHAAFQVVCYASQTTQDAITAACRSCADLWRETPALNDQQLADLVRQDRIDILVDLTMHMEDSRLLAFARKPAPVQATYLAYCGTTGLSAIDYRLTDPYLDPPGTDLSVYSEKSARLPRTYWCYRPMLEAPPVNEPPAASGGAVAFGCLNNFCKVSPPTLQAWGRLLSRAPGSRLLLHARPGSHRQRVLEALANEGVAAERVAFVPPLPGPDYFLTYHRIDIGLDPFPYGGGTTTCDALWMGVPVVSLAGRTAVGRGGASILANVGLGELVAADAGQYVRVAADLAADRPRLAVLRAGLRQRMAASPLMDAPQFARDVEAAYRQMWRTWCARAG